MGWRRERCGRRGVHNGKGTKGKISTRCLVLQHCLSGWPKCLGSTAFQTPNQGQQWINSACRQRSNKQETVDQPTSGRANGVRGQSWSLKTTESVTTPVSTTMRPRFILPPCGQCFAEGFPLLQLGLPQTWHSVRCIPNVAFSQLSITLYMPGVPLQSLSCDSKPCTLTGC